jgi:hypothetical protein
VAAACLALLAPAAGCLHIQDVSSAPAYAGMVGASYRLPREATLLNDGGPERGYYIVCHEPQDSPESWFVASVPEGWRIKVEAVKRETGQLLMGPPVETLWAFVSLDDPRKPSRRIRATITLDECKELRKADD